ncbi:MAG: DUF1853 family protein [Salinimicrobium sp.]
MYNHQKRLKDQFTGFLRTPQIWSKNDIFEYDLFELAKSVPSEITSEEIAPLPTGVLGKRMEYFFRIYIDRYSEEEILACNEQIFREKQTIGELDFLLKHSTTKKITHVELVYKFYLYDPDLASEEMRWIGPNRKDKLARKLTKLRQKQFPLLHHHLTAKLLSGLNISAKEISQKVCFKACLFVPLGMEQKNFQNINPDAILGFWIRSEKFTAAQFGNALFNCPEKQDWPVFPEDNTSWANFENIKTEVDEMLQHERSPLVWMKLPNGQFRRFFVVWW